MREKLLPYQAFQIACPILGQDIFITLVQEVPEQIEQDHEIDLFHRVFLIDRFNIFQHFGRHIQQLFLIMPDLIEQVQVSLREMRLIHHPRIAQNRVATLTAQINRSEP